MDRAQILTQRDGSAGSTAPVTSEALGTKEAMHVAVVDSDGNVVSVFGVPVMHKVLTANVTNATATMANLTGLSVTLAAGRSYLLELVLYCANSTASEGIKADFDGGAATMTAFRAHAIFHDAALLLSSQSSALATDFAAATVTGDSLMVVKMAATVNAGGTFIPRFAEDSTAAGTATAYRGSHLIVHELPA